MRIGTKPVICRLEPLHGVRIEYPEGKILWVAEHSDPQLELQTPDGKPLALPARGYEFTFTGYPDTGTIAAPCLYFDYGKGFSEGDGNHTYMIWRGDGVWTTSILLPEKTRTIRLDPSIDMFESGNLQVTVRRVRGQVPLAYALGRSLFRTLVPGVIRRGMTRIGVTQRIGALLLPASGGGARQSERAGFRGGMDVPEGLVDDYWARISSAKGGRHAEYGAIAARKATENPPAFKPIAYYLPQMHPFPENDAWWGRGFTEWTNVSKAVAQYRGHYQPKLPGELGFYDLRVPEVMARQIELAKLYGLHGFCFYYYWFGGKRLLEKPLDMFLGRDDEGFDFPFCLCWANENWTRRWDGAESEILMEQTHSLEDHRAVIDDLLRYFRDRRYITVEGRPVILVYRPLIISQLGEMLDIWRARARECGFPGLHIVATNSFGFDAPEENGFDAICGFPPHGLTVTPINFQLEKINSRYEGWVFDYAEVVDVEHDKLEAAQDRHAGGKGRSASHYPGVMVAWDNEARKPEKGNVFHDSRPSLYRKWLASAADATIRMNPAEERFVFINAWNEWAEGAYLEPDRRFGYGCLAATADVLREASADKDAIRALAARSNHGTRRADTAICLHIYYPEMIGEFVEAIAAARRQLPIDVILTIPDTWTLADAQDAVARLEPVRVIPSPNRGRDVLPFLLAMREGLRLGYKFGCKVHSKKSPQLSDGDAWRRRLIDGLLCPDALTAVKAGLQKNKRIVLAAPAEEFVGMADDYVMQDNMRRSRELMSSLGFADAPMDEFVAGTMFWFRFSALEPMARLACNESHFGPELGQLDGTLAHAFERVFVPFAKASGGEIDRYDISRQSRKQESTR